MHLKAPQCKRRQSFFIITISSSILRFFEHFIHFWAHFQISLKTFRLWKGANAHSRLQYHPQRSRWVCIHVWHPSQAFFTKKHDKFEKAPLKSQDWVNFIENPKIYWISMVLVVLSDLISDSIGAFSKSKRLSMLPAPFMGTICCLVHKRRL